MTEVVHLADAALDDVARQAARVIDDGRLVVVPADAMYAVLANPFHPHGTDRVFAARRAPRTSPLPVVVHNPRQLAAFAEVSVEAQRLMDACWPGPLTLVLAAVPSMAWDLGASAGAVAVRMPAEPALLAILAQTGPLACTAAAPAGGAPTETVEDAMAALGDDVALYLDGGPRSGPPSTVVDVSRGGAEVRRPGPISADTVFAVANGITPPDEVVRDDPPPAGS